MILEIIITAVITCIATIVCLFCLFDIKKYLLNDENELPFGVKVMMQLLLETNSEFMITATDSFGNTLLHYACKYGYKELVVLLLDNNAKLDVQNKYYFTPAGLAKLNNQKEIVQFLEELEKKSTTDKVNDLVVVVENLHNRVDILEENKENNI